MDFNTLIQFFMDAPITLLIILLLFSHGVYYFLFRQVLPTIANGSIIMALGIFIFHALPSISASLFLFIVCSIELFIIWVYLFALLLSAYSHGDISLHGFYERINIGAWVAGTALAAVLLNQVPQQWHGGVGLLAITAFILWCSYLYIFVKCFITLIRKKFRMQMDGKLLLTSVSVQSMVLLLHALFHDDISIWFYQILIVLGFVFYTISMIVILRYFIFARYQHVIAIWPNENCIMHGALSITGFAMVSTSAFSYQIITYLWIVTLIFFCVVELLELGRLILRVKKKGIYPGIGVYHVSQWSRNFTFGMFYSFSIALVLQGSFYNQFIYLIATKGQYIVLALLLIESILLLHKRIKQL